jgi:hypothetical protein
MKIDVKAVLATKKLAMPPDPMAGSIRRHIQKKDEFILGQLDQIAKALAIDPGQAAQKLQWLIQQMQKHQVVGSNKKGLGHQADPEDPYKGRDNARRTIEKVRMRLEDLSIRPMIQASDLDAPIGQLRHAEDILMKDRGMERVMNEQEQQKSCGCREWQKCEECEGDTAIDEAEYKYLDR